MKKTIKLTLMFFVCLAINHLPFANAKSNPFQHGCWVNHPSYGTVWCGWDGVSQFQFHQAAPRCCGCNAAQNPIAVCDWDTYCKNIKTDACGCTSSDDTKCVPNNCNCDNSMHGHQTKRKINKKP